MSASIKDQKKVKVTVNGREMEVSGGITILQSLLQENIHIPHLCYDIRLPKSTGNCGLCVVELNNGERDVKACQTPMQAGLVITTTSPKLEAYRKVRLEQLLSDHNADCEAPCVMTCPAHIDIQAYLTQVEKGNFDAALRVIKEKNPFPVACGRVCPHPCESECRRNLVDQPVAINHVKRFVADTDMAGGEPWIPRKAEASGKKIAIVGAGPSGLTAAYFSAIKGHDITVFERQPLPGGMMRYGIPEYRLPKVQLDREIDVMRQLGVKIQTGKSLGTHLSLEDLQKNFDSVYLSIGSWRPTPMQVEGENRDGVWLGINYLEQVTAGAEIKLGKTVVVIGGGNTAIDCSRTALRMGAEKVILAYRRTRKEMPAEPYEVDEALHEGVQMEFLSAPVKITSGKEGGMQLHCIRMELGEPDRSGRRRPVPIEGSEYVIEADTIIGAIGQSTNTQFLYNDLPVNLNKYGDIEINGRTMQCSSDKIFAGGDCVTGPATVVAAVAAGRNAAISMDEYLTKGFCTGGQEDYSCNRGSLEDLPRYEFEQMPRFKRAEMPALPLEQCIKDFREVQTGLAEESARAEAARCLHCGCDERNNCALRNEATAHSVAHRPHIGELPYIPIVKDHDLIIRDHNKCISCGRCVAACAEIEGPDVLNFYLKSGKMLVGTKSGLPLNKTDCVSCGQCANACPCGALDYRRDRGEVFKAINDPSKVVIGFIAPAVRSVISDHFGIPFDKVTPFMAGMLKKLGFDKVFDVSFAADLTIWEETTEFLGRFTGNGVMPQFTSCCPGWVNFVEKRYPDLIPHLSSCKSPQQMTGATIKNHYPKWAGIEREKLYTVSIMPCVAKKGEAARPEMFTDSMPDVDAVLTTTELIEMFRLARLDVDDIGFEDFDEPYRQFTGAGVIFGASGGVAEASLRLAVEKVTGEIRPDQLDFTEVRGFEGVKEATIDMNGTKVKLAVISGLHRAEPMLEKMRNGIDVGYDLIEVMACPGGCICGAGHPVPEVTNELSLRQKVLFDIDKSAELRKSQDNPDIARLYNEFFGAPNSEKAHHLLHTHYAPQQGDSFCNGLRNKSDSAFKTHVLTICTCDSCAEKGSRELLARMEGQVKDQKLSPIMQVHSIRLKENHGNGIYVSLNGEVVEESSLNERYNIYSMIHNASPTARELNN